MPPGRSGKPTFTNSTFRLNLNRFNRLQSFNPIDFIFYRIWLKSEKSFSTIRPSPYPLNSKKRLEGK